MNYETIVEKLSKEACKKRIDQFSSWVSDIEKELLKQTIDRVDNWYDLYVLMAVYIAYDNHVSRIYYRCYPNTRFGFRLGDYYYC